MSVAAAPPPSIPAAQAADPLTRRMLGPIDMRLNPAWLAALGVGLAGVMLLGSAVAYLIYRGVGIWGIQIPVAWGFAITNFVWWIGIGHAGTFISAILLLLRQRWRNSINRFAEAMTLFAVANAGLFPLLHLGRIWKFYWLFPYPSTLGTWPQWRSPLVWDAAAVGTYAAVSILFWYLGLLPDLATMRDHSRRPAARAAGAVLSLGWRGSVHHWRHHQTAYLLLAGLATPLVVSVHSIVSLDFATAIVPGWHSTIFPPYFVAGAIYSGFAMVIMLAIPLRRIFRIQDLVTLRHLDLMAKVMLIAGLVVAYGYCFEIFTEWFSADRAEHLRLLNRFRGPGAPIFLTVLALNVLVGQALWLRAVRRSPWLLFVVSAAIQAGMWLERYDIVVTSLERDHIPSAWGRFVPTFWDWATLVGTLGLFALLFVLFLRLLPMCPIYELRELQPEQDPGPPPAADGVPPAESDVRAAHAGLLARFPDERRLAAALRALHARGFERLDAFMSRPLHEAAEAIRPGRGPLPFITLAGGLAGGSLAFWFQWWSASRDFPWRIAGRLPSAWPSFIPITFEMTILGAALAAFVGVLVLCRLPRPYEPVMDASGFAGASADGLFIAVSSAEPLWHPDATPRLLQQLGAVAIAPIPGRAP